jgi:hypothetical protein
MTLIKYKSYKWTDTNNQTYDIVQYVNTICTIYSQVCIVFISKWALLNCSAHIPIMTLQHILLYKHTYAYLYMNTILSRICYVCIIFEQASSLTRNSDPRVEFLYATSIQMKDSLNVV